MNIVRKGKTCKINHNSLYLHTYANPPNFHPTKYSNLLTKYPLKLSHTSSISTSFRLFISSGYNCILSSFIVIGIMTVVLS